MNPPPRINIYIFKKREIVKFSMSTPLNPLLVFEMLCGDDDDELFVFLPLLSKFENVRMSFSDDKLVSIRSINFNDAFSLGFFLDKESEVNFLC